MALDEIVYNGNPIRAHTTLRQDYPAGVHFERDNYLPTRLGLLIFPARDIGIFENRPPIPPENINFDVGPHVYLGTYASYRWERFHLLNGGVDCTRDSWIYPY